jgi:hypothetical protein
MLTLRREISNDPPRVGSKSAKRLFLSPRVQISSSSVPSVVFTSVSGDLSVVLAF